MTFNDFAAVLPHLDDWGITRVADTTHLDRTGIPTASAVKPGTADGIWVYSGKATTQDQARLVAVFECLERTLSQWPSDPGTVCWAPPEAGERDRWVPARFTQTGGRHHPETVPIRWVTARLRDSDDLVEVPAHAVFNGRPPAWADPSPFAAHTSNGLAAHTSRSGALEAALCEVIERHTVSLLEVTAAHGPYVRLASLAARLGLSPDVLEGFREDPTVATTIDPATLPSSARAALASLQQAGLRVTVKLLAGDIAVPCYGVAAVEPTGVSEYLACAGYGTRPDHEKAVNAALLELAQTRATDLQGAREDRHLPEKSRISRLPRSHWLLDPGPAHPFPEETAPVTGKAVEYLESALAVAGFSDWAVYWFPAPDGVYACRVISPELETWHVTAGNSRFGPSVNRRLSGD